MSEILLVRYAVRNPLFQSKWCCLQLSTLVPTEMSKRRLYLHAVSGEEEAVEAVRQGISSLFQANAPGPTTYVTLYAQYTHLLDDETRNRVHTFIDNCGVLKVR